jgi:hypothetical protein
MQRSGEAPADGNESQTIRPPPAHNVSPSVRSLLPRAHERPGEKMTRRSKVGTSNDVARNFV